MTREEKNSGVKKTNKFEINFDTDDDEPIGSLLKLKKSRKNKKVQLGLDCPSGKGNKHGALEEKSLLVEEDLGGMDDTLASFKKKLKGPKKELKTLGPVNISSEVVDVLKQSLNESSDDGITDSMVAERLVEMGRDEDDDGSRKRVAQERKGRAKRLKFDATKKVVENRNELNNVSMEPQGDLLEDEDHPVACQQKGSGNIASDLLEDSLSPFFRKALSAEVSTSHASLVSRKEEGTHPAGLSHYSEGVSEDFSSVEVESHHLSCLSNELLPKNQTSKESLCIDSGSAPDASNMMKYENINENNQSACCCMEEGNNLVGTLIPAQKEPSFDGCGMEEVHNGNVNNAARAYLNDSSACDGNAVSQSESVKHELKHCSSRKLYTSVQVIGESCKSVPVTGMEEETHGLSQVESSREFTNMLQEGKDGHSCSGFVEENLEPCKNHRLSDVFGVSSSQDNDNQCNSRTVLSKINLDVGRSTSTNSHHSSSPHDQFKGTPFPGNLSTTEEVPSGGSPLPTHPDDKDNCPGDSTSVPHSSSKDIKLSAVQRELRTSKKCRHGDMAYEGDAEWEILMNGRSDVADNEPPYRSRGKTDLSSNGGAVAVSVGLRARAAGPVEKVKFKEVLKRKGGLQEYIECRNWILSLWNEDVSHILPLVDCGVAETPAENEPARASLTREIYAFLDQSGYINTGVASAKCSNVNQSDEIIGEQNLEMFTEVSLADTDDKISSERGQIKISDTCINEPEAAIVITQDCCKQEGHDIVNSRTLDLPSVTGIDCLDSSHLRSDADLNLLRKSEIDVFTADSSSRLVSCSSELAEVAELVENISSAKCISNDQTGNTSEVKPNVKAGKRIIVVGGGPAGLTAARHLHRQGFAVTVLEARSRLGGRVYTDHLSLSVPVDLGASIITGVEADVDTERRPDPSSLISSQLGLELTVLNSDCPLYDIATGQKVPADLDEALEAEYNSLLDDMVWVIAQNGERAMQMSLEDGLEYALRRRRMAQLGTDVGEDELQHSSLSNSKCRIGNGVSEDSHSKEDILSPLERRVMNWHFAHLEYGCAALLKEVSLPYWNQDDVYGGFGGAHCMIKGGYSKIVESLAKDLNIHLSHIVTDISYGIKESAFTNGDCCRVKVSTSNGCEFLGDAVLVTVPLGCLKYETIKFLPPLPEWKQSSVKRLGFGVLNKIVLEFAEVFWDDSVDYFGATAEETNYRGQCFMFWNVKKTVGAPVLIALLVGKAAIDGQTMSSHDHVDHAIMVLRKLFGQASVPDPVASVVTDWGRDPFSYGAYSYVAIGASGEDYDILGKPVDDCLFFAGEATCKEHPDTVGGAMMSGLREAVRIIDILSTGNDYRAEVEAMEAAQRQSDSERDEVRDVTRRLEAVEISNFRYKNSLEGDHILSREALLRDLFFNTKTTAGRLHVAKALLRLPVETFKSFAGTKEGLSTLNSWILDSMGKDGTQLLRHCVRLLVVVSTDLLAVRLSGIGKTVKEKVCVHTSRDIRAIASQLVTVWLEVFRKEKASNGGFSLLRQNANVDHSKSKSVRDLSAGKLRQYGHDAKGNVHVVPSTTNAKRMKSKLQKSEIIYDSRSESNSSRSRGSVDRRDTKTEDKNMVISEEEQAAFAAAEAARAAALAAAEAYASSEAKRSTMLQLPKIPSFHKFARREQYAQMDESELRRKWSGGVLGRQDCISEIDSRNCRVRNWDVDFPAACVKLDSSRISADNLSQRSHSNDIVCHLNLRENSGESVAVDSSIYTQAWVDASGSMEGKDYHAIERWQSQAAAAESDVLESNMHIGDEEDSNTFSMPASRKHDGLANESSLSHITINKDLKENQRGADRIKQAVVDYVATLLMPLYKARKIDREGYKSIMKKTATKVMEQATDAEKAMMVPEFLDYKRRNKIRAFVDKLIERHMVSKPVIKS